MDEKTKLIAAGRPHAKRQHPVNPPIERASTFLFPTYEDYLRGGREIAYGRLGTSTHRALESAVNVLEGGYETRLVASGLQACTTAILAFVESGDHILVADSVYDPTRKFCDNFLKKFGVRTTYYDPLDLETLETLFEDRTKIVFSESPGSLTFEVQDLPAIAELAHSHDARVIVDNTWSAGVYYKPISLGADISVQSATKYLIGHADALLGTISSADEHASQAVFKALLALGTNVSADDAWLALRGTRTLHTRLVQHQDNALKLARWLAKRPEVETVLHPAFKSCPGHTIWKRDFSGSSGLFGLVLKPVIADTIPAFFDRLRLFGMGFSWGGFESLCIHVKPEKNRTANAWTSPGPVFRLHAGLEAVDDMTADLDRAFMALKLAEKKPEKVRAKGAA